jgi:hypothetical protein
MSSDKDQKVLSSLGMTEEPPSSKLIRLPKGEFLDLYDELYTGRTGPIRGFVHRFDSGSRVAIVPTSASSNTRIHELSHIELGHKGVHSVEEFIQHEVEAVDRTKKIKGSSATLRNAYQIGTAAMWHHKISAATALSLLEKEFRKKGYNISGENKHALWEALKDYQDVS